MNSMPHNKSNYNVAGHGLLDCGRGPEDPNLKLHNARMLQLDTL